MQFVVMNYGKFPNKICLCLISLSAWLLPCFAIGQTQISPVSRPNILLILVDDLRPELGCYGKAYAKTPNIDRLAKSAVLFGNHYTAVPTCGASRHSLLTGRLPRNTVELTNEVMEHRMASAGQSNSQKPETFLEQFRRNGYHTVGIGKISHSADGYVYKYLEAKSDRRELPHSWDELYFDPGKWKTAWNAFFGYADGSDRNHLNGAVKPYEAADVPDEGYPDGLTAALAVQKIGQLAKLGKPFVLGVGFFKPHLPFNAPKRYWDLYDPQAIPPAPFTELPEGVHPSSFHRSGEFNSYRNGAEKASLDSSVSEAYARVLRHGYMASVSYIDAQVGKLLEALKKEGLDQNTIVVLWGDHGWHLGDHRVWGKHTLSEWSLQSPLIFSLPGVRQGIVSDRIVSTIDIYPTLMNLCNLPLPDSLDGKSLVPLMDQKQKNQWEDRAYGYFNRGVTMRDQRYRITRYQRAEKPDVELYDHLNDPYEQRNIADRDTRLTRQLLKKLDSGNVGPF